MSTHLYYQSPINFDTKSIDYEISQELKVKGTNHFAELNDHKEYQVKDEIILTVNGKTYYLIEYHFHTQKSEHSINNLKTDAEFHQVFSDRKESCGKDTCLCDGINIDPEANYLVVARFVNFDTRIKKDLTKLQVKLPRKYFLVDGTLTAAVDNNYPPIRFLVGDDIPFDVLSFSEEDFNEKNSKPSRSIQATDNRIILYFCQSNLPVYELQVPGMRHFSECESPRKIPNLKKFLEIWNQGQKH